MKTLFSLLLVFAFVGVLEAGINGGGRSSERSKPYGSWNTSRYRSDSLSNPYGAGSRYRTGGLMNPYSSSGSRYGTSSWRNPYSTSAPRMYQGGSYRGRMSTNPYQSDSWSNPYGRYGSRYSSESLRNPYGAGSSYSTKPVWVYPGK